MENYTFTSLHSLPVAFLGKPNNNDQQNSSFEADYCHVARLPDLCLRSGVKQTRRNMGVGRTAALSRTILLHYAVCGTGGSSSVRETLHSSTTPCTGAPPTTITLLTVKPTLPHLELWSQCYCRYMPLIEIPGGGRPQIDFKLRLLVAEIASLRRRLVGISTEEESPTPFYPHGVGSFFPFSLGVSQNPLLASSLTLSNSFNANDSLLDSQSLLNAD
uniref:Myotubularin-related 12-like C-terminal domain-containing protein n=1 Tax=Timema monikensis TaxID=170555 RepID=A0A7R9ED54_9NEOP|nr:unnamed protein product [Timema monikensis]